MGASGIVAKLNSIEEALRYYRVCILDDNEGSAGYKSKIMSEHGEKCTEKKEKSETLS